MLLQVYSEGKSDDANYERRSSRKGKHPKMKHAGPRRRDRACVALLVNVTRGEDG